jgi:hypothetical protein
MTRLIAHVFAHLAAGARATKSTVSNIAPSITTRCFARKSVGFRKTRNWLVILGLDILLRCNVSIAHVAARA